MGNIGDPVKEVQFEPLPAEHPAPEPTPVTVPEPEQVPA